MLPAKLKNCIQMRDVRMNTAVGKESPDMEVGIILPAVLNGCEKLFIPEEIAIFYIFSL